MPDVFRIHPHARPTAQELRGKFKGVVQQSKGVQSCATPVKTPSSKKRMSSSESSSPLRQCKNTGLADSAQRKRREWTISDTQKMFDAEQTLSPRAMTFDSNTTTETNSCSNTMGAASKKLQSHIEREDYTRHVRGEPSRPGQVLPHRTPHTDINDPYASPPDSSPLSAGKQAIRHQARNSADSRQDVLPEPTSPILPSDPITASEPTTLMVQSRQSKVSSASRTPEPPGRLTFKDAIAWKRHEKPRPPLSLDLDVNFSKQLEGRDHVSEHSGFS